MNTNSFQIKERTNNFGCFSSEIIATNNNLFILLAGFPVLIFWLENVKNYLMMERKFRGLYGDVAGLSEDTKQIKLFEMRRDL